MLRGERRVSQVHSIYIFLTLPMDKLIKFIDLRNAFEYNLSCQVFASHNAFKKRCVKTLYIFLFFKLPCRRWLFQYFPDVGGVSFISNDPKKTSHYFLCRRNFLLHLSLACETYYNEWIFKSLNYGKPQKASHLESEKAESQRG